MITAIQNSNNLKNNLSSASSTIGMAAAKEKEELRSETRRFSAGSSSLYYPAEGKQQISIMKMINRFQVCLCSAQGEKGYGNKYAAELHITPKGTIKGVVHHHYPPLMSEQHKKLCPVRCTE